MGIHYGKADFITYGKPSLFLDFANKKSLTDRISGNNLITFTRTSTGTYVGSDGLIKSAAVNEPRFDHNPVTGESLGLLIEEQRTNSIRRSQDLSSGYSQNSVTIESGYLAPDGTNTAYKLIKPNGYSGWSYLVVSPTLGLSGTYTFSVFVKDAGAGFATFQNNPTFFFNTETFSFQQSGTYFEKYPNGWYRIIVPNTSQLDPLFGFYSGVSFTGDGVKGALFWGLQVEAGSFPTSYIPTAGSQVTRTVDSASITGTNFSSWYNPSEGTIISNFLYNTFNNSGLTGNPVVWQLKKSSGTGWEHGILHTNDNRLSWRDDGGGAISLTSFPYNQDYASVKSAFAYTTTNRYAIANGLTQVTSSSYTQNNTYGPFLIGGSQAWSQYGSLNRPISRIVYYPSRLTDTQLQNLTI